MKSLCMIVLSAFLVLGLSASVIAQQSGASSSAESQATKPAENKAPADDKATSSSSSSSSAVKDESQPAASARTDSPTVAPAPPSSSSSTSVDIKTEPRVDTGKSDIGSASPRTTTESRRIFGLEPTAALLIGAAILLVVVLALVAMARGSSEPSHTDIDLRR
jgi:hypothetical protein